MAGPMHCSCFQALVAALALVAGLQLLYLALLSGLHGQDQRSRYAELFQGRRPLPRDEHRERLKRVLASGGLLDTSGQYRVYRDVLRGDWDGQRSPDMVLVTHTSLGNLHHAQRLAERWQGPFSVAVFAPGAAEVRLAVTMIYAIAALCSPLRQLAATFFSGDVARLETCGDVFAKLSRIGSRWHNYGANASYPNNLLRNVAKKAVGDHWALVVDMDMVPSEGLREAFLALRNDETMPGVFVVPAFEIRHTRRIPGTKAELLRLYQVGETRPFYEELCPRCQAPTNYSQWVNLPAGGPLRVAYDVEWRDPWEPFYVGPPSAPPYDERFKQYGFNRISQACELHVAGFRFSVLSDAFLVHKGFKVSGEFHPQKDAENQRNKGLFRQFKQELKVRYPSSPRRC
uniref:Beta-1,4-glucuronyltransferase 1 n=1 Tax=Anolis carolinensis TaxID=28377 RepID=H9G6H4_ANOCA